MKPYFLLLKTIPASPIVNICYFLWENRLEVEGWGGTVPFLMKKYVIQEIFGAAYETD